MQNAIKSLFALQKDNFQSGATQGADFLESLPIAEFNRLAKVVTDFVGLDEKN